MKIIADPETGGIGTSCLAIDWNLSPTCQVQGCKGKTYAILCFTKEETDGNGALTLTICKRHYEKGRKDGKIIWQFDLTKGG